MSASRPLRALALAGILTLAPGAWVQAQDDAGQAPETARAAGPDTGALLEAERAGRLAAAIEENDRLRGEVERLTRELAAARTRVDVLTEQRGDRALITAAGIALAGVVAGMILGRLAAGRRRRGGF